MSLLTLSRLENLPSATFSRTASCGPPGLGFCGCRVFDLLLADQVGVLVEAQLANHFHRKGVALQNLGLGFHILGIARGGVAFERKHFAGGIDFDVGRGWYMGWIRKVTKITVTKTAKAKNT